MTSPFECLVSKIQVGWVLAHYRFYSITTQVAYAAVTVIPTLQEMTSFKGKKKCKYHPFRKS